MSDAQAIYTHFEKAHNKGETSQWKLHLQHQVNQMHWGVILVKSLVCILFYNIEITANKMFTNISSSVTGKYGS